MSAEQTEDQQTTMLCTIYNKTKDDIKIGDSYLLQFLEDGEYTDLPCQVGFNLTARTISAGDEYSFRAYIEHEFGDLKKGQYRIVKEYSTGENQENKETVSVEFDLP